MTVEAIQSFVSSAAEDISIVIAGLSHIDECHDLNGDPWWSNGKIRVDTVYSLDGQPVPSEDI